MSKPLKVLVCDDDPASSSSLHRSLSKFSFMKAEPLTQRDFRSELDFLAKRQELVRKQKRMQAGLADITSTFDDTDVLIVDYDLIGMRQSGIVTGEEAAYLIRCFSTCKVVVAVNQFFKSSTFDLTLRGHFDSFADVNIAATDLSNRALWEGIGTGYRPWYWPRLATLAKQMSLRANDAKNKSNVLEIIGLPEEISAVTSVDVLSIVWDGKRPLLTDEFIKAHGVRDADRVFAPARELIVASRLGKWVRTLLAAGQDVIVDAPHLIERCPSLLKQTASLTACNKTNGQGLTDLNIDYQALKKHLIPLHWTNTPMWNWMALENDKEVQGKFIELAEPWKRDPLRWSFCEDTSVFRPRAEVKTFVADIRSGYSRRSVQRLPQVDYRPELRLAM